MNGFCPHCGQPVALAARGGISVSPDLHRVGRGGEWIDLTRGQMKVMLALWRRYPGVATHENIMDALYGDNAGPDGHYATMKVQITKLRARLMLLGVGVENVRGEGYTLSIVEGAHADAA